MTSKNDAELYCTNGCIRCIKNEFVTMCEKCIGFVTNTMSFNCDMSITKLSIQSNPPVNYGNCIGVLMSGDHHRCFLCNKGYFMEQSLSGKSTFESPCIKPNYKQFPVIDQSLKNCIVGKRIEGVDYCYVCEGGYPSKDCTKCEDFKTLEKSERDISPNCKAGVRASRGSDEVICGLCTDPEMSVVGDESDKYFGMCRVIDYQFKGCALVVDNKCVWCDHYSGYYMHQENKCTSSVE